MCESEKLLWWHCWLQWWIRWNTFMVFIRYVIMQVHWMYIHCLITNLSRSGKVHWPTCRIKPDLNLYNWRLMSTYKKLNWKTTLPIVNGNYGWNAVTVSILQYVFLILSTIAASNLKILQLVFFLPRWTSWSKRYVYRQTIQQLMEPISNIAYNYFKFKQFQKLLTTISNSAVTNLKTASSEDVAV